MDSIPPLPVSLTCIVAPVPPPVIGIVSPVLYKCPSFVIVVTSGHPVIVPLNKTSSSVLSVPERICPITNVPTIDFVPKVISVISVPPIIILTTDSTIAVASFILKSLGSFG